MALQAGFTAAYRAFLDPQSAQNNQTHSQRVDLYAQAWAYYHNRMFSRREGTNWSGYLSQRELYQHTRLIYNPVTPVVDFYVDNLWQPRINKLNPSLILSVGDGTGEEIINALAQLDQWTNWQSESTRIKTYAAATGNCLVEIIDDLTRSKITQQTHWAGNVTAIELNYGGDVQSFTLEYNVEDKSKEETYRYKKVVTKETFSYFKDDAPFVPDGKADAVEDNPYGFCPAVWIKHSDVGSTYGYPACNSFDKIDELNMLAAHAHDGFHKGIEAPQLISTDGQILPVTGSETNADGTLAAVDPRINWMVLKAPNSSVSSLSGNMQLGEGRTLLDDLRASFVNDYPEMSYLQTLREVAAASGVARAIALTPAQNRLDRAAANYDQQLIKLRQMQIAIAGWRMRNGWNALTDQQRNFTPFDLKSFESGELDFSLKRALLIEQTEDEREDLLSKRLDNAVKATGLLPLEDRIAFLGFDEEKVKEILSQLAKEDPLVSDAYGMTDGGGQQQLNGQTDTANQG